MAETKKKGSGTTDLTVGRPLTRILQFALPLVLGTLFQQLYSFADTVIVGRCIGADALGAVDMAERRIAEARKPRCINGIHRADGQGRGLAAGELRRADAGDHHLVGD